MIKTLRGLGRSLVRRLCYRSTIGLAVLTFCAFVPFVSSGLSSDDFESPTTVRVYTFNSFDSLANYTTSYTTIQSYGSPYSVYLNNPFGISFSPTGAINLPVFSGVLTNSSVDVKFPIRVTDPSTGRPVYLSPYLFDDLRSLFVSLVNLYNSGYRGAGVVDVSSISTRAVNFDYRLIVSDVLSSTNTTYRQILLSHLSTISASVQNIDLNVSGLQSSIDQGNNVLSDISQNTTSALSTLSDISQSSSASSSFLSQVSSNTAASASSLSQVSSNTAASVSALSDISGNTAASASALSQVSSNTAASVSALSDISGNAAASASALSDISHNSSSIASDVGSIKSDTYYLHGDVQELVKQGRLNSYVGAALSGNGLPDPDNPFFPYDPNNPDDPNHPENPNSPWNPNSPNSLSGGGSQGAFTTNNVVKPITNSVRQASAEIQSNAVDNADRQIENANQNWQEFKDLATGDGEGLNVRIKFPLTEENPGYHVNVKDTAVLSAIEELHAVPDELKKISDYLESFSTGGFDVNLPSNTLDRLDEILDAITNRPSYLLLDDYAVYISNGVYSASIDTFIDEFPNVYSNLLKYGLSSDGNGNFWSLFGANLLYQSGLVGTVLEDLALVRDFADSHIEGGFNEGIKKIVDRFPSSTQIEDFLNSVSNHVSSINGSSSNLVTVLSSVTNSAVSAFRPFKEGEFDSPPSGELVFFKLANERYVTIPVHEQYQVWSLIRTGIAFALIAVNILFFPRFVLFLVLLFSKLSNRFVKFVPTDKM